MRERGGVEGKWSVEARGRVLRERGGVEGKGRGIEGKGEGN